MAPGSDKAAMIGAQAKFAVFLAGLFQHAGIASTAEFGELLAVFASTLADSDPDEAAILRRWATAVGEA